MERVKPYKNTILFIALFLLAGVCNLFTRQHSTLLNTVMFCSNVAIYIGLCLAWIQSVYERLLPTRVRTYIITAGIFMILYLLIRVFKYRIVASDMISHRYAGYFYFVPIIMIPTMLFITALHFLLGESRAGKRCEWLAFAGSCVLNVIALSNDIHSLLYRPLVSFSQYSLKTGTYTYGPAMPVVIIWIALEVCVGLALLFRVMGKKSKHVILWLVIAVFSWMAIRLLNTAYFAPRNILRMYHETEIDCFGLILIFESCIRSRLIPYNENYDGFFKKLSMPVLITDNDLHIAYETELPVKASGEELMAARQEPLYLNEDEVLTCMTIQSGYTFWLENEHELHEERKRLDHANQILSEENDLIAVENKLKEQKAQLDAQNRVYERITSLIYPKQKRIEELLEQTDPKDPSFQKALGLSCVLNAYSKRKSNLLLLPEDTLPKRNRELFLALAESCRFLKCCNIGAAAIGEEYTEFPLSVVHDLYDTFETVTEAYLPVLKTMTVSILSDGIRIAMEADQMQELLETSLPVACKESDGILFFTIGTGGEA